MRSESLLFVFALLWGMFDDWEAVSLNLAHAFRAHRG